MNEMVPKIGCFVSFCHNRLLTKSVHTHVYHYPLFECGMKKVCELSVESIVELLRM